MKITTIIDEFIKELNTVPELSVTDYASLIEELNVSPLEELTHYRGYELTVVNGSKSIKDYIEDNKRTS